MKNIKHVVALLVALGFASIVNFLCLPALNIESKGFWWLAISTCVVFAICETAADALADCEVSKTAVGSYIIAVVAFVGFLICGFAGNKMINSYKYHEYFKGYITEVSFEEAIPEEDVDSIATMDTKSARQYGDRKMGEASDVISQFVVSRDYTQIALNGKPMKVAPLEHNGVVKANNNAKTGIVGYVTVDPVNRDAKFVRLSSDESILYSPSSVFSYDLTRHIRRNGYRTALLGRTFFELDEEGNQWWITQVKNNSIGLFGGSVITGVLVTNPHTGEITEYSLENVPEWIDIVFDGDYISEKYNAYGLYENGYWNSIFGQKGCKVTTDDFGYKVIGNDVYIFTGVTSVTADESNVGFILTNSRTLETKYIAVNGAEEYSAMGAAEGEVQEKGYTASFPSLVNVSGEPTYVMVLKDSNGLVKNIAMVNVKQYDIIAVADNIQEARTLYLKQLSKRDVISNGAVEDVKTVSTVINSIEYVVVDGATVVYIKTDKGVFKKEFEESLILLDDSDAVTISFYETGADVEYIESVK